MSKTSRSGTAVSRASLAGAGFTDIDKALRLLTADNAAALTDATVIRDFTAAADPDLALLQLTNLLDAAGDDPGLVALLAGARDGGRGRLRLIRLLGISSGLGEVLQRHPDWWRLATVEGPLADAEALRSALLTAVGADPGDAMPVATTTGEDGYLALRREYRRQLILIADADIGGEADVGQVTAALSALADAVLEASLALARGEVPGHEIARLGIVAMGKCGAGELNYLSDVDVIFVAEPVPGADEAEAIAVATQLAQRLMNVTVAHTVEGAIWEVDAGLRPEGKAGALVRTLASHLDYYERWAKTWEFQALLKARAAAGDRELAGKFVEETRPWVWSVSRRPDFVADVQAMRRRVEENIPAKHAGRELKLGPGGIRDIEFSVQLLQLVHGASDLTVRASDTLTALQQLATWGYVGREDAAALSQAYAFQRTLEHRLQMRNLRRTHMIPETEEDLRWLGRSVGLESDPAQGLRDRWREVSLGVRRLHEKLFYRPLLDAVAKLEPGQARLTTEAAQDRLTMLGYRDPAGALRHLEALSAGVSRRAAIQRTLLPVMLGWFAEGPDPDAGLLGFRRVSDTLGATPWYLRLLRDESAVAQQLAWVLSASPYASDLLARAPEAVAILGEGGSSQPTREAIVKEMRAVAGRHDTAAGAASAVRAVRRRELFRIASEDLSGALDVQEVAEHLCDLTDASIDAVLSAAVREVEQRRGEPLGTRILVVAMGRLGGEDMSYASDADVIFVHDPLPGVAEARAADEAKEVLNLLRSSLTVPSPDPPLALDADLRPEGRQGPLVRTLGSYGAYYERFSDPWEAQALLRARPLAGDEQLAADFLAVIDPVRYPADGLTADALRQVRRLKARMESERLPRGVEPRRHTKLGPGGLSDVEWVVQLLQQEHAGSEPALRTTSTMVGLQASVDLGLVTVDDAATLREAWRLASRVRNANTLVQGRPSDSIPSAVRELSAVSRVLGYGPGEASEMLEDYFRATRRARNVFERLFYDGATS